VISKAGHKGLKRKKREIRAYLERSGIGPF
jgi:hypothetical protein